MTMRRLVLTGLDLPRFRGSGRTMMLATTCGAAMALLSPVGLVSASAGDLVGKVVDATSGASISGAVVSISGVRDRIVTGRDGSYRVSDIAQGDHTVAASFLGYKTAKSTVSVPATGAATLDIPLTGGDDAQEVVVTGTRLARARALNLQLNNTGVSNIVSADDVGRFPDNNVADAATRLPGVSVFRNRETGEGEYLTIRGLASDFNVTTVNGVRVPNTDNGSRQVSLTLVPPFGLQTVSIKKSSTPDMDGDAVGGTLDLRTPSAFDFNKPVLHVRAQYGYNERASDQGEPKDAYVFQVDGGQRFGPDHKFGVYATAYYYKKNSISEESENDGEWTPYVKPANSQVPIDYRTLHLPGLDLDYYRLSQERYGGNLTLDYQDDKTKLYLIAQAAKFKKIDDHSELIVKARNLYDANGLYNPSAFFIDRNFNTGDEASMLATAQVGGESRFNRLKLEYNAFVSYGERGNPAGYGMEWETPSNKAPYNNTGVTFISPDPRFPEWQLPTALQPLVYDNSQLTSFDGAGRRTNQTNERKYGGKFDATYDMDGSYFLKRIKAGFKYQLQHQDHNEVAYTTKDFNYASFGASPWVGRSVNSILSGYYRFGSLINRDALVASIDAATTGHAKDPTSASHYEENIFAGYAMGDFIWGQWEAVTGLRVEKTDVHNINWNSDDDPTKSGFATTDRSYTEVLPSIHINYRASEKIVYRAAIWTSFSRPAYQYIAGGSSISRDGSGAITSISRGNPDLHPMESLNYDASAEYYLGNAGLVSLGVFYKDLSNYIFTNGNAVSGNTVEIGKASCRERV